MGIATSILSGCVGSLVGCCVCQGLSCIGKQTFGRSARLGFSIFFTLAMIIAWVMRDFAQPLVQKIPWISAEADHSDRWYGVQAVYRISLGNFAFYAVMCLSLVGVKYKHSFRSKQIQNGGWMIKFFIWVLFNVLPFFLPNSVIAVYGWMARIGSPVFLLIQVLMLLDFALTLNESWVLSAEEGEEGLYKLMLGLSVVIYLAVAVVFGFLFHWFATMSGCTLNILFMTVSILLIIGFTAVSMHPYFERGSLFASALVSAFCVYLQYSALASEPPNYPCNGLGKRIDAASGTAMALGMIFSIVAVVYSAWRAGSNTVLFFNDSNEDVSAPLIAAEGGLTEAEDPKITSTKESGETDEEHDEEENKKELVDYNYSFFHVIFALASMYIAMLMTGWGVGQERLEMMDVGWVSVWIKMVTFWVTAALYSWIVIAPQILSDREFN